jgi:hypothetical protein
MNRWRSSSTIRNLGQTREEETHQISEIVEHVQVAHLQSEPSSGGTSDHWFVGCALKAETFMALDSPRRQRDNCFQVTLFSLLLKPEVWRQTRKGDWTSIAAGFLALEAQVM